MKNTKPPRCDVKLTKQHPNSFSVVETDPISDKTMSNIWTPSLSVTIFICIFLLLSLIHFLASANISNNII